MIDPRISLAGTPAPNVGQRFGQALQNVQALDNIGINRDLAPLQLQQAQRADLLGVAMQPANMQAAEFAASDNSQSLQKLKQDQEIGISIAQQIQPFLAAGNIPEAVNFLARLNESDPNLGLVDDIQEIQADPIRYAESVNSLLGGGEANKFAMKFSVPKVDDQGRVYTVNSDPSTGISTKSFVEGATGQTPEQKRVAEVKANRTSADLEVETAKRKATVVATVGRTSAMKKDFSESRKQAARSSRKVAAAMKLTSQASQGLSGVVKLQLSRVFPGIDASNEGALSSAFKTLSLAELEKFKGPTTDFEFEVTEDIAGSLGQGAFANQARLTSLNRNNWFIQRESEQFDKHIKDGHDPDQYSFNMNELVTPKKGGKSYTLQSLQDTAVANHISIDEAIKRLSNANN